MNHFELYKELYHKENERRNEIQNALNIPIAIISAFVTVIYFLLTNFNYKSSLVLLGYDITVYSKNTFFVLCILSIVLILLSIFFLVKVFSNFSKGYEYSGLAYPQELYNWSLELQLYYQNYGDIEEAEKIFEKHIIEKLVQHSAHNMMTNDKKYSYIYQSKKYLTFSLLAIVMTMIPFCLCYFMKNISQEVKTVKNSNQALIYFNNSKKSTSNGRKYDTTTTATTSR